MGWDCTLHLVDEASLARFVARFLDGRATTATAFDRAFSDADDLVARTKQLIGEDPAGGARALGELALLFVSAETPHAYCRGFALSLWDRARLGPAPPRALLGSIEMALGPVLARYPQVAGRMPREFDGNGCVGPYVAPGDVPALLAHVERATAALIPGERTPYQPLLDVLRAAVARGCGYWEGTDLRVGQAHEDWLLPAPPSGVRVEDSALGSARPLAREGLRLLLRDHFVLWVVDITTFPPHVEQHSGLQATAGTFAPWGGVVAWAATDPTASPYRFSLHALPPGTAPAGTLPFEIGLARGARDAILLFPNRYDARETNLVPLVLRPGHLAPLEGAPSCNGRERTGALDYGAFSFGDGSALVVWDGTPYRWDGGRLVPLGGGRLEATDDNTAVTLSDGSIVGGFGRRLVRIDREGRRETVLPLDNVMSVVLGPDDVLIIREGDNPEADMVKIWWPRTRELTHVQPERFGRSEDLRFVYFAPAPALLVVAYTGEWRALPWTDVAALPRVREDAFCASRAALVARKQSRR